MHDLIKHPVYRPPAEADSLILQLAHGCPHNTCAFCGMYKQMRYVVHTADEADAIIAEGATHFPDASRIFLADGDIMHLAADDLIRILERIHKRFNRVCRISLYANGRSILEKTDEELRAMRNLKLHTLYMGLESGLSSILTSMHKPDTVDDMIAACVRSQAAGLRLSVMVLIGLAGRSSSLEHARVTAGVLNRMQPRLLSALRVIPVAGTKLYEEYAAGRFEMLSEREAVLELLELVEYLQLDSTVFRSDHSSNIIPVKARLPRDQSSVVQLLEQLTTSGKLDDGSPGPLPSWL